MEIPAIPTTPVQPVKLIKKNSKETLIIGIATFVVVALGILTGYKLSGGTLSASKSVAPGAKDTASEAGIADESTFRDSADGKLEKGGISGEGTHHLVREGGLSQYVYLTSTVIDLESFVGKEVTVWGETISAKKAGWLMDVGKLKVKN